MNFIQKSPLIRKSKKRRRRTTTVIRKEKHIFRISLAKLKEKQLIVSEKQLRKLQNDHVDEIKLKLVFLRAAECCERDRKREISV